MSPWITECLSCFTSVVWGKCDLTMGRENRMLLLDLPDFSAIHGRGIGPLTVAVEYFVVSLRLPAQIEIFRWEKVWIGEVSLSLWFVRISRKQQSYVKTKEAHLFPKLVHDCADNAFLNLPRFIHGAQVDRCHGQWLQTSTGSIRKHNRKTTSTTRSSGLGKERNRFLRSWERVRERKILRVAVAFPSMLAVLRDDSEGVKMNTMIR